VEAVMGVDRQEIIRQRAFEIWEDEGRPDGADERHWLQAEDELFGEDEHETMQDLLDEDDHDDDLALGRSATPERHSIQAGPAGPAEKGTHLMAKKNSDARSSLLTELGVLPPERDGLATLTLDQQEVLNAYHSGRMKEADFQRHLATDTVLADHVRSSLAASRRN